MWVRLQLRNFFCSEDWKKQRQRRIMPLDFQTRKLRLDARDVGDHPSIVGPGRAAHEELRFLRKTGSKIGCDLPSQESSPYRKVTELLL